MGLTKEQLDSIRNTKSYDEVGKALDKVCNKFHKAYRDNKICHDSFLIQLGIVEATYKQGMEENDTKS